MHDRPAVLNGKVMRKVGVEVVGLGAIKLTGFLRELMERNNMNFESLYTVRTLKEVLVFFFFTNPEEISTINIIIIVCDVMACFSCGQVLIMKCSFAFNFSSG